MDKRLLADSASAQRHGRSSMADGVMFGRLCGAPPCGRRGRQGCACVIPRCAGALWISSSTHVTLRRRQGGGIGDNVAARNLALQSTFAQGRRYRRRNEWARLAHLCFVAEKRLGAICGHGRSLALCRYCGGIVVSSPSLGRGRLVGLAFWVWYAFAPARAGVAGAHLGALGAPWRLNPPYASLVVKSTPRVDSGVVYNMFGQHPKCVNQWTAGRIWLLGSARSLRCAHRDACAIGLHRRPSACQGERPPSPSGAGKDPEIPSLEGGARSCRGV